MFCSMFRGQSPESFTHWNYIQTSQDTSKYIQMIFTSKWVTLKAAKAICINKPCGKSRYNYLNIILKIPRFSGLTWEVTWCWSKWERCWNLEKISSVVRKASGLLLFLFCPSSPSAYVGKRWVWKVREGAATLNWSPVVFPVCWTGQPWNQVKPMVCYLIPSPLKHQLKRQCLKGTLKKKEMVFFI